jgi:hypothetical protein
MKIRQMGVKSFHANRQADRQTDTTQILVAFRNLVNAPQNGWKNAIHNSQKTGRYSIHARSTYTSTVNHNN